MTGTRPPPDPFGPLSADPAGSVVPQAPEPEPTDGADTAGSSGIDPEVQAFQDVCTRLAGFDERLDAEWADGYLTAVAASWRVIPREEWLPRLVQDDAFERTFADPTDQDQALNALDAHVGLLRRALDPGALLDEPDALRLAPLMQVWDDAARAEVVREGHATDEQAQSLLTGARWAEGFFAALEDFEADWPGPEEDAERAELFEGLLQSVAALAWDPASPEFRDYAAAGWKDAAPTRDELIDEAAFAVQDLRVYWLDHAPRHAPRRVEATPGRNDPCPCGSGRKWKRCHGA